ncbi:hypothetical protein [Nocardioides hungaricus]
MTRSVWRHKVLALAVLVVTGGAVAAGLVVAPKTYSATATLSAAASPDAVATGEDLDSLRGSLGELANSEAVVTDVADRLSEPRSADELREQISGRWVSGTVLVAIEATDADPRVAAEIANTVAAVLPLYDPSSGAFLFTTGDPAQPPATFSSPNLLLGIGVGAALAVVLAVCAALLRERRTAGIGDACEVEQLADAPVLLHLSPPKDPTSLPALYPGTAAADVFRQLRVALEAAASSDPVSLVVVSGLRPGDVDVWLGANLAISLATVQRRALLVDGRIGDAGSAIEGGPDTIGLYDVLDGAPLVDALSPGPVDRLTVLPAGEWGGEPAETLLETRFAAVMAEAATRFDVVVVLAPPLDAGDDARVMAAGGSLLLAVPDTGVSQRELRRHLGRVRSVGVRLLGVVLVGKHAERMAS